MIEVTVKTLDGKNRAFSVPDEITVQQFKKTIAASIEITADIQRLIFKGRILSDEKKINDYDVNGKTIHVVQKLPPVSAPLTSTTSSSTDPLPSRTRDSDESGRSGRRIFLGSYALAPDGTNVMQQILDDLGETITQGQRTQTQNQEDGLPPSVNNPAASQNRSSADSQSRINHVKKLLASAKRSLELLESPSADSDANLEDSEQTDPTEDHVSSAEQGTSSQSAATEQDQDSQNPSSSVVGDLFDEVMLINERLQPHLVLYQQLLRDQCVYRKKSRKLENAQRLSNLVPRTMHYISHVYHNLSDLSVDVSSAPPRRIQAPSRRSATIIQQTIPVLQAEISLSGGPLATDVLLNSTATSGSRAEPQLSSASTEVTEPESGSARSRSMLSRPRSQTNLASMAWTSASGTSSLSSVFPLFFSSSLGSSLLPTNLPRASSFVATTSTSTSASAVSTSSTPSTVVPSTNTSSTVVPGTTTSSTTGASNRSGGRRGYRRFTEAARTRPSVNISSQDFVDPGGRHVDPYLACHSRHFRTHQSAQSTSTTGRNTNSSLADMISNIVSSIMTTTGETPADASVGGRRGNEDDVPAAASFSTHFDSPATQALQMLDDPEMEEEVISSWHPLDDDNPFVRNIFGATERSSESARLDHQILNMMINRDNWLEGLLCCVLDCLSFTDVVTVLSGVLTPLTRLREPLLEFVTSTVLNGEEPTDENLGRAVDHMMDDLFFCLEEIACDLEPLMDVDFASSLSSFLRYHLKRILGMIMKSTAEDIGFSEVLCNLLRLMATELVCLCEGCLSRDGFITLIQQRLWHFLPFGVHSAIRNWTQVQLRHFQRSVLPNVLQSAVYERHVVFTPQSNSTNRPEASATAEHVTIETTKKVVKESNGTSESSEMREENASTSQGPSSSSALNLVVDENVKDRCRRGRKSVPSHEDNLVEEVSIKRRRISNCEGQNGGVEWTSFSVTDGQNDSDETRPAVAVTFSRDSPFEDGSAGSNERLQNGVDPPAPTPFPDAEDLSSNKN